MSIVMADTRKEVIERGERNKRVFVPLKVGQRISIEIKRDDEVVETIEYMPTESTEDDANRIVRAVITTDFVEDQALLEEKVAVGLELSEAEEIQAAEKGLEVKPIEEKLP